MLLNESLSKDMENKKLLKEQTDEVAGGWLKEQNPERLFGEMAGVERLDNTALNKGPHNARVRKP